MADVLCQELVLDGFESGSDDWESAGVSPVLLFDFRWCRVEIHQVISRLGHEGFSIRCFLM
jgi:hypothetical protein